MSLLPFANAASSGGGGGTVTSVSVVTANGISGSVANPTTTPAITLSLGAITPTSVNAVVISGASTPTLAVTGTSSISGSNTGDQTITLSGAVTGSGTGAITTTFATPGTLSVSSSNSNANAHTHAITSSSAPGAAASILATDASGIIGSTGTRIVKGWFTDLTVTNAIDGSITGSAPTLTTTRTIWGQNFNGSANVTGDITLGTSSITMTGSIGATAARVTKGWFTDLEVTNAIVGSITGNAATVTTNANLTGVITSSGNATSIASQTGTGTKFVVDTSPTLITPNLGTPSAVTLTNGTGLPISTGVSGLGTGVATFLATPSSANLATAVTDETGSGALVFGTSPSLTTPVISQFGSASGVGAAWSSWTPTWTNVTIGSATVNGAYIQIGKIVHFRLNVVWAANTSASGNQIFSLPVTAAAGEVPSTGIHMIGVGNALDSGTNQFSLYVRIVSTTTASADAMATGGAFANPNQINATTPMTWTTNDTLNVSGTYEAA